MGAAAVGGSGSGSSDVGKAAVGEIGERVVVVARLEGEEINPQNHHDDQQNHRGGDCVHAGGGGTLPSQQLASRKALEWLELSLMAL